MLYEPSSAVWFGLTAQNNGGRDWVREPPRLRGLTQPRQGLLGLATFGRERLRPGAAVAQIGTPAVAVSRPPYCVDAENLPMLLACLR